MAVGGALLRLYDAATGEPYLTQEELEAALAAERDALAAERARAEAAETRALALEEELRRLREG